MNRKDIIHSIESLFEDVCSDLFESLNCTVRKINSPPFSILDAPIACIDAGSHHLELMTGIQLPMPALALTYPTTEDIHQIEDEQLEDWISELSSQLIGRLKSVLSNHNCHIELGLPTTCYGADVTPLSDASYKKSFYYELEGHPCFCHIAVETYADDFEFTRTENKTALEILRSELVLF